MTANLKPLLGVPAGLLIAFGLAALPSRWEGWGFALLLVATVAFFGYMWWDMRRANRRLAVAMRRMRYLAEQDRS